MGAAFPRNENASTDSWAATSLPWWIRLSRWLNGTRICAVADCIELNDSHPTHCRTHTRSFRAQLGERTCHTESCTTARVDASDFCGRHLERELIINAAAAPYGQWNAAPARPSSHSDWRAQWRI